MSTTENYPFVLIKSYHIVKLFVKLIIYTWITTTYKACSKYLQLAIGYLQYYFLLYWKTIIHILPRTNIGWTNEAILNTCVCYFIHQPCIHTIFTPYNITYNINIWKKVSLYFTENCLTKLLFTIILIILVTWVLRSW